MRWLCWNMQYHTAHHAFPGVPCHRLPELQYEIFTSKGLTPPTMSYLGFLAVSLRAFWGGYKESDYPDDAVWIADGIDPAALRLPPAPPAEA